MLYALIVCSFLLLSNIPLYGCTKVCLTIHPPFKDLWLIYSLGGGVIKYCGYLCALFVWVSFHVWYITNKHGERCPTSLVISKMQTKNKVRDQYPLLRTGEIKESDGKCWLGMERNRVLGGLTDSRTAPLGQGVSVAHTAHLLILWLFNCTIGHLDHTLRVPPWAREMTQWVKVLAIKPDNLSVIPRTHSLDRKNWLIRVVNTWIHALTETLRHDTHTKDKWVYALVDMRVSLYKQYHIYAWFISEKSAASVPPVVDWSNQSCRPFQFVCIVINHT